MATPVCALSLVWCCRPKRLPQRFSSSSADVQHEGDFWGDACTDEHSCIGRQQAGGVSVISSCATHRHQRQKLNDNTNAAYHLRHLFDDCRVPDKQHARGSWLPTAVMLLKMPRHNQLASRSRHRGAARS